MAHETPVSGGAWQRRSSVSDVTSGDALTRRGWQGGGRQAAAAGERAAHPPAACRPALPFLPTRLHPTFNSATGGAYTRRRFTFHLPPATSSPSHLRRLRPLSYLSSLRLSRHCPAPTFARHGAPRESSARSRPPPRPPRHRQRSAHHQLHRPVRDLPSLRPGHRRRRSHLRPPLRGRSDQARTQRLPAHHVRGAVSSRPRRLHRLHQATLPGPSSASAPAAPCGCRTSSTRSSSASPTSPPPTPPCPSSPPSPSRTPPTSPSRPTARTCGC